MPESPIHIIAGGTRDIRPIALDEAGRLKVLPAAVWDTTTRDERALFGKVTGTYCFPTQELVDHLRELIAGRTAIEIGAGNGVLAEHLGIPATDSMMQIKEPWAQFYGTGPLRMGPAVPYGPNVVDMHASRAVRRYKPQVVVACWVTHKDDPARQLAPGNPVGVDEDDILANCEQYVMIGNERVHVGKPIWERPHTITYPPFLRSRAVNGSREFIAVWKGGRARRSSG